MLEALDYVRPMCFPRECLWKPRWLPIFHCKIPEKAGKIPEKMFSALVFWVTESKRARLYPAFWVVVVWVALGNLR